MVCRLPPTRSLGVYRPSVTGVARTLQQAGLIRYSRGSVTILDRPGLEDAASATTLLIRTTAHLLLTLAGIAFEGNHLSLLVTSRSGVGVVRVEVRQPPSLCEGRNSS